MVQPAVGADNETAFLPPVPFLYTGGYSDLTPSECFIPDQNKHLSDFVLRMARGI